MNSEFHQIKLFPKYSVSRGGDVIGAKGKILKPKIDKAGYARVQLYSDQGKKTMSLHRVVAIQFIENPEGFDQVNHIDGIKTNNAASNLEWCDAKHNTKHAIENGLMVHKFGEEHSSAKLTSEQVKEIRGRHTESLRAIADDYGVSRSLICLIRNDKLWNREGSKLNGAPK